MIPRPLFAVLICVGAALVRVPFAMGGQNRNDKEERHSKTVKAPLESKREDSAYARNGKNYSLLVELFGFSVGGIPSAGLSGGYYLSPDQILEASYVRGSISYLSVIEIFSSMYTIRLKKFWGNSFYTNFGAGTREIGAGIDLKALTGDSTLLAKQSATSAGIELAIGNRWQYDTFTIGCDWIGFFAPLTKLSYVDEMPAGADPADAAKQKDAFDKIALTGNLELLRFYLGVSF